MHEDAGGITAYDPLNYAAAETWRWRLRRAFEGGSYPTSPRARSITLAARFRSHSLNRRTTIDKSDGLQAFA